MLLLSFQLLVIREQPISLCSGVVFLDPGTAHVERSLAAGALPPPGPAPAEVAEARHTAAPSSCTIGGGLVAIPAHAQAEENGREQDGSPRTPAEAERVGSNRSVTAVVVEGITHLDERRSAVCR